MEELARLRTELDRLRKRECEFLQELFDVHAAAEILNQKIDDIAKLMQPAAAIDRLPVEVFSRILHLALYVAHDRAWSMLHPQRQQFASVSRWWRDAVLNTPSLWSVICVSVSCTASFVETQVKRSREHPLDITALYWWHSTGYDALLRSTCRWRSLTIGYVDNSLLLDLSRRSFPRLKHVHIQSYGERDVEFFTTDNTPVLEKLVLEYCCRPITSLPTLEKLTTLTLYGNIDDWQLKPQSIHLPLLRTLAIDVDNPNMLLKAIVTPELSQFDYSGIFCRIPFTRYEVPPAFDGLPSVFNKVHCVSLRSPTKDSVATVCQVFPNVRHLQLRECTSRFLCDLRGNTDLWDDLEFVTFYSLRASVLYAAVTELQEWLRQRKPTAKPLHVRFTRIKHRWWEKTGHLLSMLYELLHENCSFEVDEFVLTERMRMTSWNRALHIDLQHVPSCVANMRLGQDVPWHESMDDPQDVSEDDPSDDEEEESSSDDYW